TRPAAALGARGGNAIVGRRRRVADGRIELAARHREAEDDATRLVAVEEDRAAVRAHELVDDVQPQPEALAAARRAAERLEQPRPLDRGDAAAVLHLDAQRFGPAAVDDDAHAAVALPVPQPVRDEVRDHLRDAIGIERGTEIAEGAKVDARLRIRL